ncbi:MAG TPA: FecR domain-containing protein [Bacteroidales bacterium]|nr:FecR domain-containing protein [Bacteroidales bacterium]
MTEYDQKVGAAISSVINGNPSDEEQKLLDSWISESDENRKFFELMMLHPEVTYDTSDELKERIFNKVKRVLPVTKTRRLNYWIPAAVAAIAVLLTLAVTHLLREPLLNNNMVYLEATTPFGVKTKLVLPDSSVVFLNSGTYLKYPARFTRETRDVYLKGEAYFEVQKDKNHPFVVKTPAMSVKVLGTHFNVKAFPDENLYETTLLEGSVALYNNEQTEELYRLKPNQKVSFSETSGNIRVQKVDAEMEASWRDGKFYFDDESLSSIVKNLERNFNVHIRITSEKLKDEVFSGFFDKDRTLYQTLDIMMLHKNFYYKTQNDTILIYMKDKQ